MSPLASSFITYVAGLTPGLYAARQDTIDFWTPDEAPSTIAFADLGERVVDDFHWAGPAANTAVFRAIESAFASEDLELTLVVANGMVYGIVDRALNLGLWDDIRPMLGPMAASCADRWVWFRNHELPRTLDEERGALLSDIRH